jgi:hypothetical protein
MRRPFGVAACPRALRKSLTLNEKSAACPSDFFPVDWRRLAEVLQLTIFSEPFGYARKVVQLCGKFGSKFSKSRFSTN